MLLTCLKTSQSNLIKTYVKGRTGYVRTMVGDTIQTFDITEFVEKKINGL
jgi:hypothetical protein